MAKEVECGEIDLSEIEYRNEYRHTKAVFSAVAIYAWQYTTFVEWASSGTLWKSIIGGTYLSLALVILLALIIEYRSRVVITGSGVTLRRPILPDVEIPYSEFGKIEFNGMSLDGTLIEDRLVTLDLSAASRSWAQKRNLVKIHSRDGKKKITIKQALENFDRFCDDLSIRHERAIERYQGYAKGTSLRQPERYLQSRESIRQLREPRDSQKC